jgi:hypothetical protein
MKKTYEESVTEFARLAVRADELGVPRTEMSVAILSDIYDMRESDVEIDLEEECNRIIQEQQ